MQQLPASGMNFYGEMPDSYTLVVNTSNKLIEDIRDKATAALDSQIKPLEETVEADNKKIEEIRSKATDGKLDAEAQKQTDDLVAQVNASRDEQQKLIKTYAQGQPVVRQLIDLALLGNGLLKGKDLSDFIARSVSMIK